MTEKNATVTKPLFAAVGAGDAVYTAALDVVTQVRERAATTDVSARVEEARGRIATVPADVQAQFESLRGRLAGLPSELPEDLAELREKFTAEELRVLAEKYYRQVLDAYADLAVRGEETYGRLRTNHLVEDRIGRVEGLYKDATVRAEEAIGRVNGLLGRTKETVESAVPAEAVVEAEVVAVSTAPAPAPAPAPETEVAPVADVVEKKAPAARKAPAPKKAPVKKAAPKQV